MRVQVLRAASVVLALFALTNPPASLAADAVPAQERLKSCDPSVAIGAVKEFVSRPEVLNEPLELFAVAEPLFLHGQKDAAVFWFYAAQLRTRYQLIFDKGDRGQLLQVMMMSIGPLINSYAFQDVSKLERTLDRVLEWDRKTPNPYRGSARSKEIDRQIEQVYSGLRDLKAKLASEKADVERKARLTAPDIERGYTETVKLRCDKNQIDPAYAAQATRNEQSLVAAFVKGNDEVIREAGEIKQVYPESSLVKRDEVMPHRYIVSVVGTKTVHAVIDVSRTAGKPSFTLTCVSHLSPGQRDPFKDVCAQ